MPFDPAGYETKQDEIVRICHRAAEIIEERGWCRNTEETSDGRVCMAGAIRLAIGLRSRDPVPDDKAAPVAKRLGFERHTLIAWNDVFGRTKKQVIARLRAVS